MASVAEVGGAEAEENGHRAAVATLVLEVVGAVARAHLRPRHVAASAAHQFGRIERVHVTAGDCLAAAAEAHVHFAAGLAAVISLARELAMHRAKKKRSALVDGTAWLPLDTRF